MDTIARAESVRTTLDPELELIVELAQDNGAMGTALKLRAEEITSLKRRVLEQETRLSNYKYQVNLRLEWQDRAMKAEDSLKRSAAAKRGASKKVASHGSK